MREAECRANGGSGQDEKSREEKRSWNKRKYLATYDVFSKSHVMLKRVRA